MTTLTDQPLEEHIAQWRGYVRRRQALHGPDVEELEGHLRDQLAALTEAGLSGDEAFLVAVKRMGSLDALSREFARAHSERLWKQLVMTADADRSANTAHTETLVVLGLAVAAALATKVPRLFGVQLSPDEELPPFYFRNASLFVLPLLAVYFAWKRGLDVVSGFWLVLPFAAGAVFANVYPFRPWGDTEMLDGSPPANCLMAGRRLRVRPRPLVCRRWAHELRAVLGRAVHLLRAHRTRRGNPHRLYVHDVRRHRHQRCVVRRALAAPVRRSGGGHHRLLACGGQAERHREHGAGADEAVHAAVHGSATGVSGHDGVDGQPHQRAAGGADRLRPAAGGRRWAGPLRRIRARPAGTARTSSTACSCCS